MMILIFNIIDSIIGLRKYLIVLQVLSFNVLIGKKSLYLINIREYRSDNQK